MMNTVRMQTLNDAQRRAVEYIGKHLLIVAGPGTGKTHTLTHRIATHLKNSHSFKKILAITFTNKAAQEMADRLSQRLLVDLNKIEVGTFHSFCLKVLKQYHQEACLPASFCVVAPEAIQQILPELWPDVSVKERKRNLRHIFEEKMTQKALGLPPSPERLAYDQFLRNHHWLDYDDLLIEMVKLLKSNPFVLKQLQETYSHLFVDEYQDINDWQHALLLALVTSDTSLTAIGDPNQSIYGFRGSNVSFFNRFKEDFPNSVILNLSENYRSSANLITASSQVMAKGQGPSDFSLTAKIYKEGRLTIHQLSTDKAEAEYVVHEIEKLLGGLSLFSVDSKRIDYQDEGGYGFGDIVVLYRLHAQAKLLCKAFHRSGIPFSCPVFKSFATTDVELVDDEFISSHFDYSQMYDVSKVQLLSIHAAKGLEFSVVFIVGCEEGLLPLNLDHLKGDVEEERRLFYVGMTRAKDRLYLLSAKRRMVYGQLLSGQPSLFLSDIEEKLKAYEEEEKFPLKPKSTEKQLNLFG